jgi:hypothetical protein
MQPNKVASQEGVATEKMVTGIVKGSLSLTQRTKDIFFIREEIEQNKKSKSHSNLPATKLKDPMDYPSN